MTSVPDRMERPARQARTGQPRFGQLVYTSFDDRDGAGGGWRVKEETGGISPVERQEMTSRIVTNFDVGESLPQYPNDEQIASRPARLMYGALTGDRAGYWHTVDAGKDATGRPDNVLAHVVLDRDVTVAGGLRPIELWGSAQWLRAYGAAEVTDARLASDDYPQPTGELTCTSVVRFLTGMSFDKQLVFRVLLDAVHGAMSGGRGVILTTHEPRQGHWWIAALSYFMSPGVARRFSWSTYDDPYLAGTDMRNGVHMVIVAADRARDLPRGKWLVLDDRDQPFLGALGSSHGTGGGDVEATSWSILAEAVLADADMAERLIERQDAIAAELGDRDLSAVWPLAVAVREELVLNEFHQEADRVIADEAPMQSDSIPWLSDVVSNATIATAPNDVDDALDRLIAAQRRGVGLAAAATRFAALALSDDHWVNAGPLERVPEVRSVDIASQRDAIERLLGQVVNPGEDAGEGSAVALRQVLRLIDLLGRIVAPSADFNGLWSELLGIVDIHVSALSDGVAARAVIADPGIRAAVRERVVRPAVARLPGAELEQFGLDVWQWLFEARAGAVEIPPNPHVYDAVLLPRYIAAELEGAQPDNTGYGERLAADAITLALGADDLSNPDCRALVRTLARFVRLSMLELMEDLTRWPTRVPPAIATPYLLSDTVPYQLLDAVASRRSDEVLTPGDEAAVALARLRSLNLQPKPWGEKEIRGAMDLLVPAVAAGLQPDGIGSLHDDVVIPFGALTVCKQALDSEFVLVDAGVTQAVNRRLGPRINDVAEMVADMVEAGVVDVGVFVAAELLGRMGFVRPIRPLLSESLGGEPAVPDRVVRMLIGRQSYRGPVDLQGLRDAAWPAVKTMPPADAESFFHEYPRVAREWLYDNGIGGDQGGRSRFRRMIRED